MPFHPEFSRGVAMVLKGESTKAACYVSHNLSLGVLREKMVNRFVRDATPDSFRVETGMMRANDRTSRQCDILIHDPKQLAPYYRWEDFVIVDASYAKAVVEVKSEMNAQGFESVLDVHSSIYGLTKFTGVSVPTLGYGLEGVGVETFVSYIKDAVTTNRMGLDEKHLHLNWPYCVAVESQGYLGFRPTGECSSLEPPRFCVIDFKKSKHEAVKEGLETGYFLLLYENILRQSGEFFWDFELYDWVTGLPVENDGKYWISVDGTVQTGDDLKKPGTPKTH